MNTLHRLLPALLAAAVVACGGDASETPEPAPTDPRDVTFADELDIDLDAMEERPSGLYVVTLTEGEGEPAQDGDRLSIHYTGWLATGKQFDSSQGADPFVVTQGGGGAIAGFSEGVAGMRLGEVRRLVIPPALGYGEEGAGEGVIPSNATLVFRVELAELQRAGG